MKRNVNLSLDYDVYAEAQELIGIGNISESVNEHLKNMICIKKDDINAINIKLLERERDSLSRKMAEMSLKLTGIKEKILVFNEIQAKKQVELLENQKKDIENSKKCDECKQFNEFFQWFGKYKICNICYSDRQIAIKYLNLSKEYDLNQNKEENEKGVK